MWMATKFILAGAITLFWLQNTTPSPGEAAKAATASSAAVAPTQPVITVHGVCETDKDKTASDPSKCRTVITREQFENLMNTLNPAGRAISARGRQNLAQAYAESLALDAAARKTGLEDTDEFRELMSWTRQRVLADLYRRKLEEKYRTPSQEEVDEYYRLHLASYERVKVSRILVPREGASTADKGEFEKKALEAANAARKRAAQGEDPDLVQKDVYSALGLAAPPPTTVGKYGRANFLEKEGADVFSLKAGEVSQVEIEPKNYVIYKVDAKETLAEDDVKAEISKEISQRKFKDAIKAATDAAHAEFDEAYFGAEINVPPKAVALPATPPAR